MFEGKITVIESSSKDLEINLSLNGFEAQKCSFPFTYNSVSHSTCINENSANSWCSPVPTHTNQSLNCDTVFHSALDECPGNLYTSSICGEFESSNIYSMKFSICPNSPPTINSVSVKYLSYTDTVVIDGSSFSQIECENEIYIGNYYYDKSQRHWQINKKMS